MKNHVETRNFKFQQEILSFNVTFDQKLTRSRSLHVLHRGRRAPALLEERRVDVGRGSLRGPLRRSARRSDGRRPPRSHVGALHVGRALREALLHGGTVPVGPHGARRGALGGHAPGGTLVLRGSLELLEEENVYLVVRRG